MIGLLKKWKIQHIIIFMSVLGLGFGVGHIINGPEASELKKEQAKELKALEEQINKDKNTVKELESKNKLANQKIDELQKQLSNMDDTHKKNKEIAVANAKAAQAKINSEKRNSINVLEMLPTSEWESTYAVNKDSGDTSDTPPPRYANLSMTMTGENTGEIESNNLLEMGYAFHTFEVIENTGERLVLSVENPYSSGERNYDTVTITATDASEINVQYWGTTYKLNSITR